MPNKYRIELDEFDLGQIIDGLKVRANAWEQTAAYHRTGTAPPGFLVEECADAAEADRIAAHYRAIISKIQQQREAQS